MKILFFLFLPFVLLAQSDFEKNIDTAYQNAKKGIYWAYSNIPDRKNSLNKELIDNNTLISKVKLTKQIKGLKVEAYGYYNSNEVRIIIYRSYDSLIKDGYLKEYFRD
jgi:hypothetical protein